MGKFIIVEGSEMRGKSTVVVELAAALRERGHRVHLGVSPVRGTLSGKRINHMLKGKDYDRFILQWLMFVNRVEDLSNLYRMLEENDYVIYDRYYPSAYVYGDFDGVPHEYTHNLSSVLPVGDYVFVLCGKAYRRRGGLGSERYDDFMHDVEKRYLSLCKIYGWTPVRNDDTPRGIAEKMVALVDG